MNSLFSASTVSASGLAAERLRMEVVANNMFREAFLNLDRGLGAALAVLIFVSVLPILYINIRRMQKAAV